MIRQLAQLAGILALVAGVILMALGGLSHWRGILTGRIGEQRTVLVRSSYGKLQFDLHQTDAGEQPRWLWSTWPHEFALSEPNLGGWWRYGGFGTGSGGTRGGNVVRQVTVPYWALVLFILLLGASLSLRPNPTKASEPRESTPN